jgi:hypothetical protein
MSPDSSRFVNARPTVGLDNPVIDVSCGAEAGEDA